IKPLNKLIEEAIKNHESELKTHKRDELAYQARLEGLRADLKSASKTTARKKAEHTANELVDLIMEAEDNAPPPPVMRRYLTNDATIEKLGELERDNPNGILLMRDELMGWLAGLEKEGKQEDRAFYLEGFNGTGSKVVDRIMRGSTFIENHCLSVLGGIQPDKLIAYFEQQISGLGNDGLLQRFQLLVYPDAMTWGYRDRYQNKDALNAILELFKKLSESDFVEFGAYPTDEYNKRPYFRFTLDAQAFFIEWLKKLNTEIIANEENTLIQQHLGKYARLMPSLALIFHLVDCVTHNTQGQVGLESAKQAVNWCEYLETHARRVYGLFDGMGMRPAVALSQKLKVCLNPTAKTDETSEDWLKDGFVFRDIRRKQWQHLKDDISIKKALTVLLDNHWIYPVSVKSASNGGRPTTRYYISQKLKVCLNPTAKTDETQKMNNFSEKTAQKIGFGSFGSTHLGDFENLENDVADLSLNDDFVNSANSTNWSMDI
ncbi:MAG TPA: YfjI family protein, partial [Agitococcus sp.]|nr:YfjI family protein [Agitococcus sp.]